MLNKLLDKHPRYGFEVNSLPLATSFSLSLSWASGKVYISYIFIYLIYDGKL